LLILCVYSAFIEIACKNIITPTIPPAMTIIISIIIPVLIVSASDVIGSEGFVVKVIVVWIVAGAGRIFISGIMLGIHKAWTHVYMDSDFHAVIK
jgi:hypothetical protein